MALASMQSSNTSAPVGTLLWGHLDAFAADKLGFLVRCAEEHGDIVPLRFGPKRFWFLSDPDLVGEFLASRASSFKKNIAMRRLQTLFGDGLLISDGPEHDRRMGLLRPALSSNAVIHYATTMAAVARRVVEGWKDGQQVDVFSEFSHLTITVLARALFGVDLAERTSEIIDAFDQIVGFMDKRFLQAVPPPLFVPTRENRRIAPALALLEHEAARIVAARSNDTPAGDGLLLHLLGLGQASVDLAQLRADVKILLFVGSETSANTLTFVCHLLARHPDVLKALRREVREVLCDRDITAADPARMPLTRQVIQESLRLYPPGWLISREAAEDVVLGGRLSLRRGDMVGTSTYIIQRDPRWFPRPLEFRPDRFAADAPRPRPNTYFPFGMGARGCTGQAFGQLELSIVLPTLLQRCHLEIKADGEPALLPQITLRPSHPITAVVRRHAVAPFREGAALAR